MAWGLDVKHPRSFALCVRRTPDLSVKIITGNVHIEYRSGHSTYGVSPAKAHYAAAMLPAVRSPQTTLSIWQVLAVQVLIFMGQMQSAVAV